MTRPTTTVHPTVAAAVSAAIARNRTTRGAVARKLGMSPSAVGYVAAGRCLPTLDTAAALADLLDAPDLIEVTIAARTRTCEVCGDRYIDQGKNGVSRACTVRCQRVRHQRIVRGHDADTYNARVRLLESRLRWHKDAVRAFCLACTARTMVCRQPDCELRPISPARLVARRTA